MLKPGIKIGPIQKWRYRFRRTKAKYCEVWYRADRPEWYQTMFSYLHSHRINAGLHFWGIIANRWEPNLAYPGPTLEPTRKLIKQSLQVAAKHHFIYVNVHVGTTRLIHLDLDKNTFLPDNQSTSISLSRGEQTLQKSWQILNKYATDRGILLLIETVPSRTQTTDSQGYPDRNITESQYTIPVNSLIKLAKRHNILVTNDFCHTFADEFDQPLDHLWQALWDKTIALAPYTKLLHINTVVPPYNGTDSHDGITDTDFQKPGIFPTKAQLIKLLKLFKQRDDVWAINEPHSDHVANYQALNRILNQL